MKKVKRLTILMVIGIAFICTTFILAEDWPQYLGPNRNGTSSQTELLRTWPEGGPEVLWTVDVGIGYGGPVIKDGKVYLLDRDKGVGDIMRCFDFSTGKELWRFGYDAPGSVMFPGSRSVPAVDGDHVYSCGQNGDLYCLDINTHKPVWHKNIWTDFGGDQLPIWAITQCPLIYGDLLIVLSQAPNAGVIAYDKLTGEVSWKTPNLVNESYASPSVVKIDGQDHIAIVISSTNPIGHRELPQTLGNVVGIDPSTGKIQWEYKEWECHISVPSAVDAGDNRVLVAGGYELGAVMLKVEKKSDGIYGVSELFKTEEFGAHTQPPLLHNGYFYAQYGTNYRRDGLVCMSLDGRIMWKTQRSPNFDKGSMILAEGLILATDGRQTLYLIEPDPSEFKPLALAEVLGEAGTGSEKDSIEVRVGGSTQNWAPIALSDAKLLIRDHRRMMCVKVAK